MKKNMMIIMIALLIVIVNSKPLFFEKRYFQLNLYRKLKSFITVINQATKKQNVLKDSENN